jgi:hypothetical protein
LKNSILPAWAILLTAFAAPVLAQDCGDLLDPQQVLDFYVTMDPADWEELRFSCPGGLCGPRPHFYWNATFRCEDGPEIAVGIRRKRGQAIPSETDPAKPAIKIDINEFVPGQLFSGKAKLNLENGGSSAGPPPLAEEGEGEGESNLKEGLSWLLYGETGIVTSRVAWVNLWVNGNHIGLYMHIEQVDKSFLIDHGIDEGGWLFKGPGSEQRTREGEPSPFAFNWYPFDHTNPADPQPADWHDQTEWRVDMTQMLTLAAVTNFVANKDAVVFKNNNYWYYDWSVFPDGQQPRLYLGWDLDTTMNPGDFDLPILGTFHNNGHIAQGILRDDPVFQAQYYQIYNDLLGGPLSLASTSARLDLIEPVIAPHIDADPHHGPGTAAQQFQEVRDFLQARTAFVLGELGACPNTICEATETPCTCPADCGSPPPNESTCTDLIDEDCDGSIDCSDSDCIADPACDATPLLNQIVVNEVVANSPGSPDVEFVEIANLGPGTQDLSGWYILDDDNGHDVCLLDAILNPGEYLVVAGLIDEFSQRYPEAIANLNPNPFDSDVAGQGFSLGDDGDHVRLFRPGSPDDEFVGGYTIGLQSEEVPFGHLPNGSGAPEYITFPTPGSSNNVAGTFSPICINEFLTTSQAGGVDDWIELYNRGSVPVDIGGWFVSDNVSQPTKYAFPPGTTMAPGEFLAVDESELGFALSSTGSEVILLTHSDGETGQDYFDYDLQFPDVTQGRFPDGGSTWLFFSTPSRDLSNACRVSGLVFTSSVDFSWDPTVGAGAYDVVSGDLVLLRSSFGDFSVAVTGCDEDVSTGQADEVPGFGEALFYLVRAADSSCGVGTYDSPSSAQVGERDPGIQSSAQACP